MSTLNGLTYFLMKLDKNNIYNWRKNEIQK